MIFKSGIPERRVNLVYSKTNKYVGNQVERMPQTRHRRQRGSGLFAAPLSYLESSYREPSASAGSTVNVSQAGLARPSLNMTGGSRNRRSHRLRRSRGMTLRKVMRGGFFPGVMGAFVQNAKSLIPVVGVTGYRMFKNFNKTKRNRY